MRTTALVYLSLQTHSNEPNPQLHVSQTSSLAGKDGKYDGRREILLLPDALPVGAI